MKLQGFIVLFILFFVYRWWFLSFESLSSGDWPYLFLENIREFSFTPMREFLWLAPYYQIPTKLFVDYLNLPWELAERILWFWPFLGICIVSSYYLTRSWIGVLIYTTNTYILMVVGGGQMGIAMAYSIVPFILKKFISFIELYFSLREEIKNQKSKIKNTMKNSKIFKGSIALGLALSVLTMFDPRVAYICMIAILLYSLLSFNSLRKNIFYILYFIFYIFVIPVGITVLLSTYWIIPLLVGGISSEYKGLESVAGLEFLSFADFSHAFSLLHPNWPENIFGKTYFLQPEFLLLPILAYSSLLFISKIPAKRDLASRDKIQNNLTIEQFNNGLSLGATSFSPLGCKSKIIYFCLLGILGAFLAKGVNEPFGFVNERLFQSFPGMSMFRDPTKFYLLIALSYSVLIPFSVSTIYEWLSSKFNPSTSSGQNSKLQFKIKNYLPNLILIIAILYLIFLIRPAIFGQLGGTFKPQAVPEEYIALKNFIQGQEDSFNTLWVPKVQRFGFSSKTNQAISLDQLLRVSSISAILKELQEPRVERTVKSLNIKYIIVPYDSQKEIFLQNRKYDFSLYNSTVFSLQKLEWVEKDADFGKIIVFRVL